MKKEAIIAIIGGFILGLIITFGIATAQKSLNHPPANHLEDSSTTPSPIPNLPSLTLFVTNPQPNAVSREKTINVSGSTCNNCMVGLVSTNDRNTTVADSQGNFSLPLELISGANIIDATSFNPAGQFTTSRFTTIYLAASPPASSKVTPTPTTKPAAKKVPTPTP